MHGSTVVEHMPHDPNVEGSRKTGARMGREKMDKSKKNCNRKYLLTKLRQI
jgi:hypothetical protein